MKTLMNNIRPVVMMLIIACFCELSPCNAQCTAVSETDSLELVNIYQEYDGENWADGGTWLNGPVSSWNGIYLSNDGCHVRFLDFAGFNMIGDNLPDPNLPKLEFLGFANNPDLTGSLIDFTGVPNLETLSISYTGITGPLVDFQNLPKLREISLHRNQFEGEIPNFASCPDLFAINLESNQLTGAIPNLELANLENLNLANNQLIGGIPDLSAGCPILNQVNFSKNALGGEIPDLSGYANLNSITFRECELIGPLPNLNFPNLQEIDLRNNELTGGFPNLSNNQDVWILLNDNLLEGVLPNFSEWSVSGLGICPNQFVGKTPSLAELPNMNTWIYNDIDFSCLEGVEISGHVYLDENENCVFDEGEATIAGVKVYDGNADYFTITDNNGYYEMGQAVGDHSIFHQPPNELWDYNCVETLPIALSSESYDDSFEQVDLGLRVVDYCARMQVEIWAPFFRACDTTPLYLDYCNQGTETAENAYIDVEMPEQLTDFTLSQDHEELEDGILRVFIGDIALGQCGQVKIMIQLDCNATFGSTICTAARIFPESDCDLPQPIWDGSDIEIRSQCNEDSIDFEIENVGESMQNPNVYRCYEDDLLVNLESFQLLSGETLEFSVPANGKAHRLKAFCNDGNPYHEYVQKVVELCGPTPHSLGFVNSSPTSDLSTARDKFCSELLGSFDPNDKTAFPAGVADQRFVKPDQEIEYRIRFQNTGNDTAFWVQLVDTIDVAQLDISSIETRVASHDYSFQMDGNVVKWTFANILLPDSTTNESESHGYVEFKIKQNENNPDGATIENFADIYFDYNEPVRTNTEVNTVCSDFDFLDLESLVRLEHASLINNSIVEGESATLLSEFGLESTSINLDHSEVQIDGSNIVVHFHFRNDGIGCAPTQSELAEQTSLDDLAPGQYTLSVEQNLSASQSTIELTLTVLPESPTIVDHSTVDPICVAEDGLLLIAEGQQLSWYADAELSVLFAEGNELLVTQELNELYVTQTVNGVQSEALSLLFSQAPTVSIAFVDGILSADINDAISYQWYQGDELLDEFGSSFVPTFSGIYFLEIITADGCVSISEEVIVELNGVGVDSALKAGLLAYPNPFDDQLHLRFRNPEPLQFDVVDVTGKAVLSGFLMGDKLIDSSSWPQGLYFLHLVNGEEIITKRIIRQ